MKILLKVITVRQKHQVHRVAIDIHHENHKLSFRDTKLHRLLPLLTLVTCMIAKNGSI